MSKTINKPIVELKVYYGKEMNYDADGKVKNRNQSIKLLHDTVEWGNQLKHLHANGYGRVEVSRAYTVNSTSSGAEEVKAVSEDKLNAIKAEVSTAFKGSAKNVKAASSKDEQIELLMAQNKALMEKLEATTGGGGADDDAKAELKQLKARYKELKGKQGSPAWKADKYKELIPQLEALIPLKARYKELKGEEGNPDWTAEDYEKEIETLEDNSELE